jgi:hypothetical protein
MSGIVTLTSETMVLVPTRSENMLLGVHNISIWFIYCTRVREGGKQMWVPAFSGPD